MCLICVECRPPELENKIITSEMLSNIEKRDWNEIFKGGQNELWQWGHWVMSKWCLLCWHRDGCRLMRIPYALFCMLFSTFILMITDYINKLTSCLSWPSWSTSRYGVLRDLPAFGPHTKLFCDSKLHISRQKRRGVYAETVSTRKPKSPKKSRVSGRRWLAASDESKGTNCASEPPHQSFRIFFAKICN